MDPAGEGIGSAGIACVPKGVRHGTLRCEMKEMNGEVSSRMNPSASSGGDGRKVVSQKETNPGHRFNGDRFASGLVYLKSRSNEFSPRLTLNGRTPALTPAFWACFPSTLTLLSPM